MNRTLITGLQNQYSTIELIQQFSRLLTFGVYDLSSVRLSYEPSAYACCVRYSEIANEYGCG